MIAKCRSGLPGEITSLDIFKKRIENVCQDKFRYCWSCFRVGGGTKWPWEDPFRPIFYGSLSVFLRLLNIPTITVLPFLNLLFKYKNKILIRTKLFLKACCWIVNIDNPPTTVLRNSFMYFKCYFIASILKFCSDCC